MIYKSFYAYKSSLYLYVLIVFCGGFYFTSVNREMSLAIDETYDASLNNRNSDKFKKYKADIEEAVSVA